MIPARKRGRALLALGVAEIGLGLSYVVDTTKSRESLFGWLPGPLHISWAGWLVLTCGTVAMLAATIGARCPRWDRSGWTAVGAAPALMAALWLWAGVMAAIDSTPATDPWSPWATTLLYTSWTVVANVASDWPEPIALPIPGGQDEEAP